MAETNIITALVNQAPGMAAIIIVVVLFLRAIETRDKLFIEQMNQVTERLAGLEKLLTSHDNWEREVIDDIQKTQQNVITKKIRAVSGRG